MIVIYDNSSERAFALREYFLRAGLPCASYSNNVLCPAMINVFFTDTEKNYVNLIEKIDPETVLYCDGGRSVFNTEILRIYERVLNLLDVKYGINPESYFMPRFSSIGEVTRFCGKYIALTATEKLIVTYLQFCHDEWCSADSIANFCMLDVNKVTSVSSFITEINRKSLEVSLFKMIRTKRGSGYRCTFR